MAAGGPPLGNPIYARLHNPTVGRFEEALAELEGAAAAVAFASGMAALTAALLAAAQRGRHVVAIRPLRGRRGLPPRRPPPLGLLPFCHNFKVKYCLVGTVGHKLAYL